MFRTDLIEKQTKNNVDYYVSTIEMFGRTWVIFVYDAVRNDDETWKKPGFLEIRPSGNPSEKEVHEVCEKFSVPLYGKIDKNGDDYLAGTFKVLGMEYVALMFFPEWDDNDNITKPASLVIRTV